MTGPCSVSTCHVVKNILFWEIILGSVFFSMSDGEIRQSIFFLFKPNQATLFDTIRGPQMFLLGYLFVQINITP